MNDFATITPRKDGLLPFEAYLVEQQRCDEIDAEGGWPIFQPQMVVMREIGMDETSKSDYSAHDDRIHEWYGERYSALCKKYWGTGEGGFEYWLLETSDDAQILAFAKDVIELGGRKVTKVEGFRAVRNTNAANGYPYFRFDAVVEFAG